ncbi:thioredoxin domain-containing protein [Candidatus Peregrinibacteria bacterium]|nr:thioredoxin domain-containing protein [Candidatus Peregrinibacteria bacterium]
MQTKVNPWMVSTLLLAGLVIGFGVAQLPAFGAAAKEGAQGERPAAVQPKPAPSQAELPSAANEINLAPISTSDHVRGPANAKITLVEFSDTECPFCKRFHSTMQQVLQKYPNDVRWVYRHFPLDQLHSKARKEAEATECANELGGPETFWAYIDRLFEVTPSNDGLDPQQLPIIAAYVGLDKSKFASCLASGKYAQHVADDLAGAEAAGGRGTPYTILLAPDGSKYPLSGALPFEKVAATIEQALGK